MNGDDEEDYGGGLEDFLPQGDEEEAPPTPEFGSPDAGQSWPQVGGLSVTGAAGPAPAGGLAAVDPSVTLGMAKQRMELLTEYKKQAAARQAAMQQYASLIGQAPGTAGAPDQGLVALSKGILSRPGQFQLGVAEGLGGMEEARRKLAEREWARQAGAQKVRAETEQMGLTDIMNEATLSGARGVGRTFAPKDYVANGHHMRATYDPNTQTWNTEDLGVAPSGMLKSGEKLKAGKMWIDPDDHSKGVKDIPGAKEPPKDMQWIDPLNPSKGAVPIKGGPKDTATAGKSPIGGVGNWTDDALQEAAIRYANGDTTVLQNVGVGKDANPIKAEIRNRAAQIHKEAGVSPADATDYAQQQRATSGALLQITKQKTAVGAFERTALNNAELALKASANVDRTGVPVFNKWLQAGRTATGSPEASKFHAANETFINEYAKVMSGGTGAAATTDSATEHARSLLNTAMTQEQYSAVVGQLKTEMSSRMNAFDQEIEHLKSTRPGAKGRTEAAALPRTNAKGWTLHTDPKGRQAYVSPDGKNYEVVK